jgi:hypothetical protein
MGISEIRQRSNQFVANLDVMIADALQDVSDELIDINREQMQESKRSDDELITPKYSPGYAKFKGFQNPNLKLTSAFHRFMTFVTDGRMFQISSDDEKTAKLTGKYSPKIFGIAPSKQGKAQGISLSSLARTFNKFVLGA